MSLDQSIWINQSVSIWRDAHRWTFKWPEIYEHYLTVFLYKRNIMDKIIIFWRIQIMFTTGWHGIHDIISLEKSKEQLVEGYFNRGWFGFCNNLGLRPRSLPNPTSVFDICINTSNSLFISIIFMIQRLKATSFSSVVPWSEIEYYNDI